MNDTAAEARYEIVVEDMGCPRPDGSVMLIRVARPKGRGPFPAVIDVHGGAWVLHDRNHNARIDDALAADGIVVASPEFRKPPEGVYPVSIADIHLGIRWLKARAAALGSRPDLVGGMGTSSGGHQLMLSALRPADPHYGALALREAPMLDATLRFAISCWGVVDPLARFRMVQQRQVKDLLDAHAAYWPDEAAMEEGNPQLILERRAFTSLPPLLIVQGTKDDNLTDDMADRFAAAYRSAGGDATLRTFEGQQHAFIIREPDSSHSKEALRLIADFITAQAGAL